MPAAHLLQGLCLCAHKLREDKGVTVRAGMQLQLQLLPSLLDTTHKLPPLLQLVLPLLPDATAA